MTNEITKQRWQMSVRFQLPRPNLKALSRCIFTVIPFLNHPCRCYFALSCVCTPEFDS